MRRIAVLGGGISALTFAYWRSRAARSDDGEPDVREPEEIVVLDPSPGPAGSGWTLREGDLVLEAGPQTLRETPAAARLLDALGLRDEALVADPRARRWIVRKGRPRSFVAGPAGLLSGVLSPGAKLRALCEPFVPRRPASLADESVHAFLERRFGAGAARSLAEPLASGIHADDPATLSVRSAFPTLWDAEERAGSVVRGLLVPRRGGGPTGRRGTGGRPPKPPNLPKPRTISFPRGLATLPEALAAAVARQGARVERDVRLTSIEGPLDAAREPRSPRAFRLLSEDGRMFEADALVSTLDARSVARLLGGLLPRSRGRLAALSSSRLAVVLQAFRLETPSDAPRGFGILIPRGEGYRSLGLLHLSSLFPSRTPSGTAVLTSFLGGALEPGLADATEDDLLRLAEEEARRLHPGLGPRILARTARWEGALPRIPVGHHATLDLLDQDIHSLGVARPLPLLAVTGPWRDGVALGERIARGEELAGSF